MEKKNEYIDKLLRNLQSLEAKVSAIKKENTVSFSFFRDAFVKGQELMNLLHEMEMFQIEDMKQQMEKLVSFLSENENRKPVIEPQPLKFEKMNIEPALSKKADTEDAENLYFCVDAEKIVREEKFARRNIHAEGIALPAYSNPRDAETRNTEIIKEVPTAKPDEQNSEKQAVRSVNDIIQAVPSKLDIKRRLSLNDRFYYQRELFDNNREAMNSMLVHLNDFNHYEETEQYLKENTSWDFENDNVKNFLELLKKGFE